MWKKIPRKVEEITIPFLIPPFLAMSATLNINADAVIKHTYRLQKIGRNALPVAVRSSLSSAAFDVKTNTMPASAKASFVQRKPTFFKSASRVEPAKGLSIQNMKATVGFVPKGGNDKSVEELEQQEHGGNIGHRSFIANDPARTSGSNQKMVAARNRFSKIRSHKIIDALKVKVLVRNTAKNRRKDFVQSRSAKQRFIRAAFKAKELYGENAFVLGNPSNGGKRTLSRINKITTDNAHRKLTIQRTPLYTYKPNRTVQVARTNFMKRASMESGLSIEKHYVDAAIKALKKFQRT